jgi:hypothetical protein
MPMIIDIFYSHLVKLLVTDFIVQQTVQLLRLFITNSPWSNTPSIKDEL